MSEEKWLAASRAVTLLKLTKGRTTDRKLRLFACGLLCMSHVVGDVVTRLNAVETATQAEELRHLRRVPSGLRWPAHPFCLRRRRGAFWTDETACHLAGTITDINARNAARRSLLHDLRIPYARQAALAREVFGNPFRPIDFAPWRTDTATALAQEMYESRDFSEMPILADALQDAGCDNDEVLTHCRDANATHVRGCWVVDGVLGKA